MGPAAHIHDKKDESRVEVMEEGGRGPGKEKGHSFAPRALLLVLAILSCIVGGLPVLDVCMYVSI